MIAGLSILAERKSILLRRAGRRVPDHHLDGPFTLGAPFHPHPDPAGYSMARPGDCCERAALPV